MDTSLYRLHLPDGTVRAFDRHLPAIVLALYYSAIVRRPLLLEIGRQAPPCPIASPLPSHILQHGHPHWN